MRQNLIISIMALILACPLTSPAADTVIIDVKQLVGKYHLEVRDILGVETACYPFGIKKYKCAYPNHGLEVVFIHDRADWILIKKIGNIPYNKSSLSLLGLAVRDPDQEDANVMRWRNLDGLTDVAFFPAGGKTHYISIRAITP
jgi:hypothetical protein